MSKKVSQKTKHNLSGRHNFQFKAFFSDRKALWFMGLLAFAFFLNAMELFWGLSGSVTWQPDAIEGEMTINHMPLLFKQWRHKYPRGQYLINWVFYKPLINHWSKHPVAVKTPSGKVSQFVITQDRVKFLAAISRWITAAMSLGAIIAVFVLTKYLFGDYLAGWLAGFSLSTSYLFLFYSGIGHVDVPFVFWFACACLFAVKAAVEHKLWYYIFAAFCSGYAFCTKEGYGAYIPGLAVAFCAIRITTRYKATKSLKRAVSSVFSFKTLTAALVFAVIIIVMNGGFNVVREFSGRMEIWKNDAHFQGNTRQIQLLQNSLKGLHEGLGWPLMAAIIAGILYFIMRYPSVAVLVIAPVTAFYFLIVVRTHFVAERFFLPAYVCFAVAVGKLTADWIRFGKIPIYVRYGVVALIGGLTVLYCIGLKLEMRNDTRNRLEAWADEHIDKNALIGSGMKRWYAPRLKFNGYKFIDGWHSQGMQTSDGVVKVFPEYLIMSMTFPCGSNYKDDTAFKKELYAGKAGYTHAAEFKAIYFSPARTLFSIAGWPYWTAGWVSPPIDIFRRNDATDLQIRK